jgi:hypothetical protein
MAIEGDRRFATQKGDGDVLDSHDSGHHYSRAMTEEIHNLEHMVVGMAHRSAHLANPWLYKFRQMATSTIDANPFPKPELFMMSIVYQGCSMSASAIMVTTGQPLKATIASTIFIVLTLGYFAFVCWHCIHEVWWKGRAKYYIPTPIPNPLLEADSNSSEKQRLAKVTPDGIPGNPDLGECHLHQANATFTKTNDLSEVIIIDVDEALSVDKYAEPTRGVGVRAAAGAAKGEKRTLKLGFQRPLPLTDISVVLEDCRSDDADDQEPAADLDEPPAMSELALCTLFLDELEHRNSRGNIKTPATQSRLAYRKTWPSERNTPRKIPDHVTKIIEGLFDGTDDNDEDDCGNDKEDEKTKQDWRILPFFEEQYAFLRQHNGRHNRRQDLVVRYVQEAVDDLDEQLNEAGGQEEEKEEREEEEGWVDVFEGDNYVDIYGILFDFARGPRTAAIFGPLDVLRMMIIALCTALLVQESEASAQASIIMAIHALQFALELIMPPQPARCDRFLDTAAMATDLVPLIIATLPDDGCGPLPVGTQMLVMGAVLLATGQRGIPVLMTDLTPQVLGLLVAGALLLFKETRRRLYKRKNEEGKVQLLLLGGDGDKDAKQRAKALAKDA